MTAYDNHFGALDLYKSKGFAETGTVYDDEIELSMMLG